MAHYTVSQLSRMAGISIRTLHHYDKIGLLKPARRAESGYRYYGKQELYRLQQILFFKELEFPLKKIRQILDDPDFELLGALNYQKKELLKRRERLNVLLNTLDKTIKQIEEENEMVTEEEMYEGFSREQQEEYKREIREKYDPELVKESKENLKKMTRKEFSELKEEGILIARELAELMHRPKEDEEVQALVKRHYEMNNKYFETSAEVYKGIADLYVQDSRFAEYYDKHKKGLAKFLRDAIHYFADHSL